MYKFKTDDKEFFGNCSDVDIDNDAQEEENEVKGIHEPFEDMDCFQVIFYRAIIAHTFIYFLGARKSQECAVSKPRGRFKSKLVQYSMLALSHYTI